MFQDLDNISDHGVMHIPGSEPWYLRLVVLTYRGYCMVSCKLEIYWLPVDISVVFLKRHPD
jgi:hypothetical protein